MLFCAATKTPFVSLSNQLSFLEKAQKGERRELAEEEIEGRRKKKLSLKKRKVTVEKRNLSVRERLLVRRSSREESLC